VKQLRQAPSPAVPYMYLGFCFWWWCNGFVSGYGVSWVWGFGGVLHGFVTVLGGGGATAGSGRKRL
jgi:hypothetical protein